MTNYNQRGKSGGQGFNRERSEGGFRNTEMHKAVCADCGKTCDVPFKPNGRKPVYCKDCFGKNGGQVTTNHFSKPQHAESRSFSNSNSFAPRPQAIPMQNDSKKFEEVTRQLLAINTKFDKLMTLIEDLTSKTQNKK